MKHLISWVLALLLAGNAAALAEEPVQPESRSGLPNEAGEAIDSVKESVNQQMMVKTALQNYVKRSARLADGVMQNASLPRHVSFHPMGRAESSQGTLLISQKGRQTAALVFMMDSLADDPALGGFFAADTMPQVSQNILTFYGRMQMVAGDIINASLLHGVEAVRDEDFPLPYDFAAVDVNQIHGPSLMSQKPRIYAADMRMVVSINGMLLPVHIRQYLFRSQAHIHFMTVICRDSEFKLVREKSDRLVRNMAQ